MTRHNEEGLVRQMCGRGRSRCHLHRESSIRALPPRTGKQNATRLECGEPGLESEHASDTVHHKFRYHTAQTGGSSGVAVYPYLMVLPAHEMAFVLQVTSRRPRSRARPCPEKSNEPAYQDSVSTPGANLNVLNSRPSSGYAAGIDVSMTAGEIRRIGKVGYGRALRTSCRTLP